MNSSKRILAVDYGDKRTGLAVTDEGGTIAMALDVIHTKSRAETAREVAKHCAERQISLIVVGMNYDDDGLPTPQGRKALRFAEAVKEICGVTIAFWDEFNTTNDAITAAVNAKIGKKKRTPHMDAIAATLLLQSYLERVNED